jgi:hypothetical protein
MEIKLTIGKLRIDLNLFSQFLSTIKTLLSFTIWYNNVDKFRFSWLRLKRKPTVCKVTSCQRCVVFNYYILLNGKRIYGKKLKDK